MRLRLWHDVIESLGIDPASETESPFYKRVGDGKLAFGLGIQKLQKACFDDIRRHRFASSLGAARPGLTT